MDISERDEVRVRAATGVSRFRWGGGNRVFPFCADQSALGIRDEQPWL